jgi:hypothetical protein
MIHSFKMSIWKLFKHVPQSRRLGNRKLMILKFTSQKEDSAVS